MGMHASARFQIAGRLLEGAAVPRRRRIVAQRFLERAVAQRGDGVAIGAAEEEFLAERTTASIRRRTATARGSVLT
jgi:hypothetical protein